MGTAYRRRVWAALCTIPPGQTRTYLEIARIADFAGPAFDPHEFFPDFDPEVVRANADVLGPRLVDPDGALQPSCFRFLTPAAAAVTPAPEPV